MWSVFCQWDPIEIAISDAMVRSLAAANECSRVLSAMNLADALAEREPRLELHLSNLSGCALRCRVRGQAGMTLMRVGEHAQLSTTEAR